MPAITRPTGEEVISGLFGIDENDTASGVVTAEMINTDITNAQKNGINFSIAEIETREFKASLVSSGFDPDSLSDDQYRYAWPVLLNAVYLQYTYQNKAAICAECGDCFEALVMRSKRMIWELLGGLEMEWAKYPLPYSGMTVSVITPNCNEL